MNANDIIDILPDAALAMLDFGRAVPDAVHNAERINMDQASWRSRACTGCVLAAGRRAIAWAAYRGSTYNVRVVEFADEDMSLVDLAREVAENFLGREWKS